MVVPPPVVSFFPAAAVSPLAAVAPLLASMLVPPWRWCRPSWRGHLSRCGGGALGGSGPLGGGSFPPDSSDGIVTCRGRGPRTCNFGIRCLLRIFPFDGWGPIPKKLTFRSRGWRVVPEHAKTIFDEIPALQGPFIAESL